MSSCYAIPERRHPEGCHHGWRGVRGPRVRVEEICPCQSARRSSQRRSGGYVWRMVGGWVFATLPKCGHEVVDCTAHYIREMLLERKHKHKGRYQHERKHPSFAHPHAHTHLHPRHIAAFAVAEGPHWPIHIATSAAGPTACGWVGVWVGGRVRAHARVQRERGEGGGTEGDGQTDRRTDRH